MANSIIKSTLLVFLFFTAMYPSIAQTSVNLKITQKEHKDDKFTDGNNLVELSDGRLFLIGVTKNILTITALSKTYDVVGSKELEIYEKGGDLEYNGYHVDGDFIYIVLKEFIKPEKKAKYYAKAIDLNSKSLIGGTKNLGSYSFETKAEANNHSLTISFINKKPNIINSVKSNEEFSTPSFEVIYMDEDFKIENKVTFKIKKNKASDADYIAITDVNQINGKFYFLIRCAATTIKKNKFDDFYYIIYVANEMGEIEEKIQFPSEKNLVYDNFDVEDYMGKMYISATYSYYGKDKSIGGFFFGVIDLATNEIVKTTKTSLEKVFDLSKLTASIKRKDYKRSLPNVNQCHVRSSIYFLGGTPVVIYSSGFDYSVTTTTQNGSYTNYYRASTSDAVFKFSLDGDLQKKTFLQKNATGVNEGIPYANTKYIQLNDESIIAFYSKNPKILNANVPLEKETLALAAVNNKKKGIGVYSVIDSDLKISKPKVVVPLDSKNSFVVSPYLDVIRNEETVSLIQLDIYRKLRTITVIDIK